MRSRTSYNFEISWLCKICQLLAVDVWDNYSSYSVGAGTRNVPLVHCRCTFWKQNFSLTFRSSARNGQMYRLYLQWCCWQARKFNNEFRLHVKWDRFYLIEEERVHKLNMSTVKLIQFLEGKEKFDKLEFWKYEAESKSASNNICLFKFFFRNSFSWDPAVAN